MGAAVTHRPPTHADHQAEALKLLGVPDGVPAYVSVANLPRQLVDQPALLIDAMLRDEHLLRTEVATRNGRQLAADPIAVATSYWRPCRTHADGPDHHLVACPGAAATIVVLVRTWRVVGGAS